MKRLPTRLPLRAPDRAWPVLDAVLTVLRATPEVVEIKRPG